ncbi:CpaF family protein [Vibrio sagamiensis]|uniref:Fimbriae assembly protein n=1 Tax=Vibrio sagamiensis NBRC 104589 TaxID=1219064 RepID=A0A511QEV2_9VIBR|nr:CpaF family protein [Vibrio sagamiensis]PNQ67659.1 CpaF family protein [Vibrio agarivorans]GEM75717.1 fimbriae assembly protein [Vibrio sagamiensis NBRC 104589]
MFGQKVQAFDPKEASKTRLEETFTPAASIREHYNVIHEEVIKAIDPSVIITLSASELETRISEMVSDIAISKQLPLGQKDVSYSVEQLLNEFLGLGPLQPLIEDTGITDIMVNGYREVYVERSGKLQKAAVQFRSEEQLLNLARRIVSKVGRRIDESNPLVDARLEDGSRVNVIIPPLALDGTYISIRKFNEKKLTLSQLAQFGAMSKSMIKLIDIIVRSRLNVLVAGGTGAGKTTLLNAMSFSISPQERIITIEDTAELHLQQPHVVRTETRPANAEGLIPITQRELVKNALRMRPDRIILGEVRGDEAFEMMQAMNTGHDGSLCTLHANSAIDALVRMENLLMMSQATLPLFSLRRQIADTIDVIIQVERMRDGKRRVVSITELQRLDGEQYVTQELFTFKILSEDQQGNLIGEYRSAKCIPCFNNKAKYHQLDTQLRVAMELEIE